MHLEGKAKDEYVVFICNGPELIGFMGTMTIKKEEDGGVVNLCALANGIKVS